MKNKFIFLFSFLIGFTFTKAQVVWSDDFTAGGGNWTLNVNGASVIPGSTPTDTPGNEWVVDAQYVGFFTTIPSSPNGGNYLHITCKDAFCQLLGNFGCEFNTANATNKVARLTNPIPGTTLLGGPYELRFEWICQGHSTAFGKLVYSVNGGPWQEYSATYNNKSTWQNEAINLSTLGWNPGQSFQFGFRWRNVNSGNDPAFGIDNVRITTVAASNSISTNNINPTIYCAGDQISVSFTSTGTFNAGNVYTLQMSDATGSFASPVVIGTLNSTANSGTITGTIPPGTPPGTGYRFRVISSNPAVTGTDNGNNITINAVVNPSVSITANPGNVICTGDNVTFTATPSGLGAIVPTYQWTVNGNPVGGNSSTYSSNSLNNGDVVQVTMSFTGPCNNGSVNSNQITMTVSTGTPAAVDISVSPNDTVCAGNTLIFTATPTNGGANPSYQWTVNGNPVGGNSATFITNSLNNGDVVAVTMTSSSSCVQGPNVVTSNPITIHFGIEATCSTTGAVDGSPATINVNISGGALPYTFAVTNFGDNTNDTQNNVNSTSTTFTHTYPAPGVYTVSVTVTDANGCQATTTCDVTIIPFVTNLPIADFTSSPFEGCGSVTVQFTNNSQNATSYLWNFGDGTTSTDVNPTHTFTNPGTYNVQLIATNANGSDTIFVPNAVFVYPQPVANALANDVCLGRPTEFTDASLHATSWNWDFGDGNTSTIQNPSHTYADTGTYTITLNITGLGGCSDSYSFTVRVTQVPTVAFSFTDNPDCNKNTVTFTNNSTNATSYLWDLGDGTFSSDTNPVHEYTSSGTYVVKLVAFAGNCEVKTQQIINVTLLPSPTVDISGPSYALTSDDVLIQVSVTGANSATIDLGDGRTITQTAPFSNITTRYENDGDYVVTLTASNGTCTSQDTFHIKVEFPEVITIPNAFTPNSDGLNDFWYPIIVGSDNYETVIYDRWGIHITTLKPNDKWDGKFNGKPCPEGVYFYNLTGTFKKGKKFKRTGSITLIR